MVQLSPVPQSYHSGFGKHCPPHDRCYENLRRQAEKCGCHEYRNYFKDNCDHIRSRCHGRNPHDYRTDNQGTRYECGRPAQTQITEQSPTKATVMAGQYKLSFDKADKSVTIQGRDGKEKKYEWKIFEDPHVSKDGKEIGTLKNDLHINLDDGTKLDILMGDGNGGPPQAGKQDFVDTVAVHTPDGTGALVTGISSGATLGVTPLDSSCSSGFLESRAMSKFGDFVPSRVSIDREGNMVDQSNGQIVHDQYGLDRLDQDQVRREAAASLYKQGYVPQEMAENCDRSPKDYDHAMQMQAMDRMSHLLGRLNHLRHACPDFSFIGMPMARYLHQMKYQAYGLAA